MVRHLFFHLTLLELRRRSFTIFLQTRYLKLRSTNSAHKYSIDVDRNPVYEKKKISIVIFGRNIFFFSPETHSRRMKHSREEEGVSFSSSSFFCYSREKRGEQRREEMAERRSNANSQVRVGRLGEVSHLLRFPSSRQHGGHSSVNRWG